MAILEPSLVPPPPPVLRWHNWIRQPDAAVLYYRDLDGLEVPLDRIHTPSEALATIIHFGLDKPLDDPRADVGALIAAIHHIRDLWRIYCRGMQVDAWDSYCNRALKWLWQQADMLPVAPRRTDFALLGDRLIEIADLLDLRHIFAR